MRNPFAEHDKQVRKDIPKAIQQRQQEFLDAAGWDKKCSKVPGVWDDKPRGHRSVSSVAWYGVNLQELFPPEWMTSSAMAAELIDVAWRDQERNDFLFSRVGNPLILEYFEGVSSPEVWIQKAQAALHELRKLYPEFDCPWSPPPADIRVHSKPRPGWEPVKPDPGSESVPLDWYVKESEVR